MRFQMLLESRGRSGKKHNFTTSIIIGMFQFQAIVIYA
jgi:hypothetical protein